MEEWRMVWIREHSLLLKRLDEEYARLRAIHEDPTYINKDSSHYQKALEEFNWAQLHLFQWKETIDMIETEYKKQDDNNR